MSKTLKYFFLSALALVVVLGCNLGSDVVENTNTGVNDNSGVIEDTLPTLAPDGSTLNLINNSTKTVCSVYLTSQESTDWGEERLGTEVLDPGESFAIQTTDGEYRVRANDCDGNLIAEYNEFEIDGATDISVEERTVGSSLTAAGEPGTLTVVNNTSDDICYVFISTTEATSWGNDWLGDSNILDAGDSETITVSAGLYDIQAADCDGNAIAEQYEVDLTTGQTWTLE